MPNIRNYWIEHHFASQDPRHPEYTGLEGMYFDTGEGSTDRILFEELGIPMSKRSIRLKSMPDIPTPQWKNQLRQANRRHRKVSLKDDKNLKGDSHGK